MFRLMGKQSGRTIAVADVGNGSVAVGIVRIGAHGNARILISERSALPAGERSSEASISGTISLLGEMAQKVLAKYGEAAVGKQHVDSACAVIHSPWTRSKTIRAATQLKVETKIERSMLDSLARQALEADTEYDHGKILEAGIIRVELNGYPTLKPLGKHAHHIAASALLSECEPKIRGDVAEALSKVFACPPPTLRSDTRALLSVTRESSSLPKESLIVNMTYEATSTIVVRKGIITETALIPEGSSSIVRRISGDKSGDSKSGARDREGVRRDIRTLKRLAAFTQPAFAFGARRSLAVAREIFQPNRLCAVYGDDAAVFAGTAFDGYAQGTCRIREGCRTRRPARDRGSTCPVRNSSLIGPSGAISNGTC